MPALLIHLVATLSWAAPPPHSDVLPLRKLRLYETGVGYFERRGGVQPGAGASLPLPASHLDDALKTLVVLDSSGNTRVTGLQFASAVSETGARAIAGLPAAAEQPVGYVDILLSLKGSEVEVRRGAQRTRGTLVEVEGPFQRPQSNTETKTPVNAEPWHAVVLVDENGGVFRLRTDEITAVQALERAAKGRLKLAADALSDQRAGRANALDVRVSSTGQIGLGYIAESPVWRTTYRVVLPREAGPGELQAWALVHNDTDEDWRKVMLELANGQPQSFLYPLAAPRYAWRDLATPPEELSTVPQLAGNSADKMWDGGESFGVGGLGIVGTGRGGGGTGSGSIGLGSVGTIGHGSAQMAPQVGDLAALSQAEGEDSGALFVYKIRDALDLKAHHSALVPIVQSPVEVESIAWFTTDDASALSGARVVNTTTQTLPAGVVAFFGDGGFIGESALNRLKPKQRQFLVFGHEQDVELTDQTEQKSEAIVAIRREGDQLRAQIIKTTQRTLQVDNRSGRSRTVYVTLGLGRNAKIEPPANGGVRLDYDEETSSALAIMDVPSNDSVSRVLSIQTGAARVESADSGNLAKLSKHKALPQTVRTQLTAVLEHRRGRAAAQAAIGKLEVQIARDNEVLVGLRKDLSALSGARPSGVITKKIARKMLDAEREVETAREQVAQARREIEAATQAEAAAWEKIPTQYTPPHV